MMKPKQIDFEKAFNTTDLEEFISLTFPDEWQPLVARIMESGVTFGDVENQPQFAPKWSMIPFTKRFGETEPETWVKSCLFRVHDVLHQLWGLPVPNEFTKQSFYNFKKSWACAEIAVLTLTEFVYADWLYQTQAEWVKNLLDGRNAILMKNTTELSGKSTRDIAIRLDGLLHKKLRPLWVRDNEHAMKFCDDYVPMLEEDRTNIDWNWELLKKQPKRFFKKLPNQRYSNNLDGLELTAFMIDDFYHLLNTDTTIDKTLMNFNRERRKDIVMPDGWNQPDYFSSNCVNL